MILQSLVVLLQVEIGITQLAIDGTEDLKILCSDLDGRFKQGHAGTVVAGFAEPLTLESQI